MILIRAPLYLYGAWRAKEYSQSWLLNCLFPIIWNVLPILKEAKPFFKWYIPFFFFEILHKWVIHAFQNEHLCSWQNQTWATAKTESDNTHTLSSIEFVKVTTTKGNSNVRNFFLTMWNMFGELNRKFFSDFGPLWPLLSWALYRESEKKQSLLWWRHWKSIFGKQWLLSRM